MNPYLPHTNEDLAEMLKTVGVRDTEKLFEDIPDSIRLKRSLNIPSGVSEYEVYNNLGELAGRNKHNGVSFLGFGCYDHIVPSVVSHCIGRAEFYTAYTPYQAEISQGILQAIFEFQTLICMMTDLDVSNASLYDGHTAASEAAIMALNVKRKSDTVLYSSTIHPSTKAVLHTYFYGTDINLKEVPEEDGVTSFGGLKEMLNSETAGVIVQSPNVYGYLEDYSGFADLIHESKALFILSSNPLSLSVTKSQGEWGADIAIGDTQPLGLPQYYGGPSVGYIAAREKLLRKMPGRIVGQTEDRDGERAFVLTLQAREQHIKRERATSNICSNQALAALANSVYLSTVGPAGLRKAGDLNVDKSHYLYERLISELPVKPFHNQQFFNEFTVVLPKSSETVINEMASKNVFAGVPIHRYGAAAGASERENLLTVAVTEKRTREEMERYIETMKESLS
jgi:glycine dehydrogenase subunit 1